MKIKLDENMPVSLVQSLSQLSHDVDTVPEEGLAGRSDDDIWSIAQLEQRFLITQDLDFSDVRKFIPGSHAGILVVRLRTPGRVLLHQFVEKLFADEDTSTWTGCFIVATERKLRIQRPS